MTIFKDRQLEFLIGLRTNWGKFYLREVACLLNQADNECAVPFERRTSSSVGANVVRIYFSEICTERNGCLPFLRRRNFMGA